MPEMSLAPVRNVAVTATRASRRLRLRRKRRTALRDWWRNPRLALHLKPRRRQLTKAQLTAAGSAGAGLLLLLTRRAIRIKGRSTARVKATMHQIHSTETAPDNDRTLADKVRTEMFRRRDAPNGAVNVSVIDGVVYLRGEVANLDEVQHLVDDALAVTGVMGVESMLHTPGTPAPTNGAG